MEATLDEDPAPAPPVGSKAGRNESRKLLATPLNNLSTASLVAALIQPTLTVIRQERPFTTGDYVVVFVFGLGGFILHTIGRVVVTGLED